MNPFRRTTLFLILTVLLIALMAGPLRELIASALDFENSYASHILLVPFVTAGFLFLSRKDIFRQSQLAVAPGAVVVAAGMAGLVYGATLQRIEDNNDRLVVLICSGIV